MSALAPRMMLQHYIDRCRQILDLGVVRGLLALGMLVGGVQGQGLYTGMAITDIDPVAQELSVSVVSTVWLDSGWFALTDENNQQIQITAIVGGYAMTNGWATPFPLPAAPGIVFSGRGFAPLFEPTSGPVEFWRIRYRGQPTGFNLSGAMLNTNVPFQIPTVLGESVEYGSADCDGNGVPDLSQYALLEGSDFNDDGVMDQCASFHTDRRAISIFTGGTQTWFLEPGRQFAGEMYLCLGTRSGTTPGFAFGSWQVPLNIDMYTDAFLATPNSFPWQDGIGMLSPGGTARASITLLPNSISPLLQGTTLHHMFVVLGTTATGSIGVRHVSDSMPLDLDF